MPAAKSQATLLGLASFQVLAMFRRGLFYTFMAVYLRKYLGLSVTEMTLFVTLSMVANVLCQLFVWGRVSDATQLRRTLIVIGEILGALGTIALWYAYTYSGGGRTGGYVIIVGLAIIEVFWSMSNVGWSALLSDRYKSKDRTSIQAQLASIGAVGRIAGVWIGGALYDGLGMKYAGWGFSEGSLFFVAAGAMLISTVPMLFVDEGGVACNDDEGSSSEEADPAPRSASLGGGFAMFLVAMVFINFGRNGIAVIRPPYLALKAGFALPSSSLSHVINMRSVAMVVAGIVVARMSKRVAAARTLIIGTCIAVGALVVLALAEQLWLVYVSSAMAGISDVMIIASAYSLASVLIPPERRGRLFAWYNATSFLSWGVAGTLIAGPIVDSLIASGAEDMFAYRMSFLSAAGITLIGLGVLAYMALSGKKSHEAMEVSPAEGD
jgi:MFS family permease